MRSRHLQPHRLNSCGLGRGVFDTVHGRDRAKTAELGRNVVGIVASVIHSVVVSGIKLATQVPGGIFGGALELGLNLVDDSRICVLVDTHANSIVDALLVGGFLRSPRRTDEPQGMENLVCERLSKITWVNCVCDLAGIDGDVSNQGSSSGD
jgi:hypothetical protein